MARDPARERNEHGLFLFFENFKLLLSTISSFEEAERCNNLLFEDIDQAAERLITAAETIQLLLSDIESNDDLTDVMSILNLTLSKVRNLSDQLQQCRSEMSDFSFIGERAYSSPTDSRKGGPGRPRYVIEEEQIRFLREMHFPWKKIANLLGVGESTLRRRRLMYGITDLEESSWTQISDSDLDRIVQEIQELTPNIGQARLLGALRSRGLNIQRWRVRNCLRTLDPVGTVLRWRSAIYRRKYNVPTPNALWHIDSNHKLIRWRLITHVCVDGYSRIIIYAHCCNNNKADTVLEQFVGGVNSYGLPSRVRSDYGMENFKVAEFMLEQRGCERGSIITGSSVHNCRVERAHRDIYSGVLCFFARTFTHLEDNGLLDPLNEMHLFALHYTFIPRINKCLQEFKRQWENHPLSTEGNRSPLQLYTAGMLENEHSGYAAVASVFDAGSMHDYGFDPSGPFPMEEEDYQVVVPATTVQLSDQQIALLENQCNPLQENDRSGENTYLECLRILFSFI